MFYLEYRPQKFSELVSPNPIADSLAKQISTGKTSHAYLFVGPRGTGKTTTARLLAKALNCTNLDASGDPCGECANCKAVERGNFLDLIEIDAASNRGIDDIRSLQDRIGLSPSQGTQKVYIIDEVHMLTTEAFNALLKTLEEPPAHATFVLCTTEPHKVLDTIKSRCQVFNFKRASLAQLTEKLQRIIDAEGVEVPSQTLTRIAQASFGGFRDAETMLQQVVQGELDVDAFLGATSRGGYLDFVDYLIAGEVAEALLHLEKAYSEGTDMVVWAYALLDYLKGLLFLKMGATQTADLTEDLAQKMEEQVSRISTEQLVFASRKFLEARNEVSDSGLATLPLELAVAEICAGWGEGEAVARKEPPKKGEGGRKKKPVEKTEKVEKVEKAAKVKKQTSAQNSGISVTVDDIRASWNKVLRTSTKHNHSVRALLKSTEPVDMEGGTVVLEAQFEFHKDRLEYSKNRVIVEKVFQEVFGEPLTLLCRVKPKPKRKKSSRESGVLTDFNLGVPDLGESTEVNLDGSLLEVFDGGLPSAV